MKRILIQSAICVCIFASLISCGKYGYDFVDGYQKGDTTATPIETDTAMNVADRSMYSKARIFPGLVGENVKRIADTTVTFDLDFKWVQSYDIKVSTTPKPIFSTGLYAPAGENIRIVVPENVIGLTAQIGVHTDNLSGSESLRRDAIIYTVKELFPGVNYIKNLYGGTIWIKPSISIYNPVKLKFAGAVRSPDFILGKTNVAQWLKDVENTEVPWIELRSERVVFSVPRRFVLTYRNESSQVEKALQEWNEIYVKDYYDWMGLEENSSDLKNSYPDLPERGVLDIQPVVGYGHNGNPWVGMMDRYWYSTFVQWDALMGKTGGAWGTFHEVGHNYQQTGTWSWNGLGETTNNLFVFKTANRHQDFSIATHPALAEQFPLALEYAKRDGSKNIIADKESQDPFFKIVPFLQIFNKAKGKKGESGWDFMPYVYREARNTEYGFGLDEAKRDFFYRALCDFTGKDYIRFFEAWGIRISTIAKREMRAKYPPMSQTIWTYDPLTNKGGEDPLPSKYDLDPLDFVYTSNAATATGESTGKIDAMKDGDKSTYWHTCYSGCNPQTVLPVHVDMDMGAITSIRGAYFVNRQTATFHKSAKVYTRETTNDNWKLQGEIRLSTSNSDPTRADRKEIKFDKIEDVRFVRFEFTEQNWVGQPHVAIAELGAFFDIN
ncbi:M60 family metallopeptidase [Sphingobacterium cellulitidis]|uniref:M60 family metallopeptidase n=1 Tax=Sphingobacterium cellulitidis TaxID=1768011 RepID=UPI00211B3B39|nr:M60 family metallopeptidase [Sphingobacterium cellulitidis]